MLQQIGLLQLYFILDTCTACILQLPHSCRWLHARHHTRPARLRSHAANAQGGLLPLEKSEASRRAAARAVKERAALHDGMKDAKVTGILVVAALTAGAMAVMQVLQGQRFLSDPCTHCLLLHLFRLAVMRQQPLQPPRSHTLGCRRSRRTQPCARVTLFRHSSWSPSQHCHADQHPTACCGCGM